MGGEQRRGAGGGVLSLNPRRVGAGGILESLSYPPLLPVARQMGYTEV